MELYSDAIGTQATTSLSHAERTASTECGTSMEDNSTAHQLTITLSPLSSGLQMETTSQLAVSKCSDFATRVAGLTVSTNPKLGLYSSLAGVMMALWLQELVETVQWSLGTSLIVSCLGLTLKLS